MLLFEVVPVAIAGFAHYFPVVRPTTRLALGAVDRTIVSPWPMVSAAGLAGLAGHVTLFRRLVSNAVDCGLVAESVHNSQR